MEMQEVYVSILDSSIQCATSSECLDLATASPDDPTYQQWQKRLVIKKVVADA